MLKTLSEIYENIHKRFTDRSKLEITPGTTIDLYVLAASDAIKDAHQEIEDSKNPHIYTKLSGSDLDSTGLLVQCPRLPNEPDSTYKYRLMNWTGSNEASNIIAIENALINMTYASYVTYLPYTEGVGTATAYIIPKSYDNGVPDKAMAETKQRLSSVTSPSAYINYVIPDAAAVKVIAYVGSESGDLNLIKENIKSKVAEYVNGIAVGSYLSLGDINKIGVNEVNVNYFNTVQLFVNNEEITGLKVLQKIHSKLLLEDIIWWTAVS